MNKWKKWLFFPVLAIGILIFMFAKMTQVDIPLKPVVTKAKPVDVFILEPTAIAPVILGYGRLQAKTSWQAIAEISGKIIELNPMLEAGRIMKAGETLIRFDLIDVELAKAQAQADLNIAQARLAKLKRDKENLRASLAIENERLQLTAQELKRQKNLKTKGLTSQSQLDREQKSWLSQQIKVQEIENRLALLPNEVEIAQAEFERQSLVLQQAQRQIEKGSVFLPFDARITSVDVVEHAIVNLGQPMLSANKIEGWEIEAQITLHDYWQLLQSLSKDHLPTPNLEQLTAKVSIRNGSMMYQMPARLTRIGNQLDANQGTLSIYLELNEDATLASSSFPQLFDQLFVQVTLEGQANLHWVIPEKALRGDLVYVLRNDRLTIVPVEVLFRVDDKVAVRGDFAAQSQLILNDLIPAIEGMAVSAVSVNGVAL